MSVQTALFFSFQSFVPGRGPGVLLQSKTIMDLSYNKTLTRSLEHPAGFTHDTPS